MITLFQLRLELIAMLFAPLLAPTAVCLLEWALEGRRRALKRATAHQWVRPAKT